MSMNLKARIQRLEQQLRSKQHRGITLDELEQKILERNPEAFRKPAIEPGMSSGLDEQHQGRPNSAPRSFACRDEETEETMTKSDNQTAPQRCGNLPVRAEKRLLHFTCSLQAHDRAATESGYTCVLFEGCITKHSQDGRFEESGKYFEQSSGSGV